MMGQNFLYVSLDGSIGDIAWRAQQEGHDVKYAITDDEFSQDVADGIGPKVDDWEAHVGWADIVVFDDGFGLGTHAERLRNQSVIFDDLTDGVEYVRATPDPYVIKPCGESQNFNQLLYVGQADDGGDVIRMLERYRDAWDEPIEEVQLQRRTEGVEISICRFFDGQRFVGPVNYTSEHKRLFPDDLGPMTGEMGTSMFWGLPNTLFSSAIGISAAQSST